LREGEQRFARTIDGQHLGRRIRRGNAIAAPQPARNRLAQLRYAGGRRVGGEAVEVVGERVLDQLRRRMLGLADGKIDLGRLAAGKRAELLEGVRIKL
jgi:hypothetical protein